MQVLARKVFRIGVQELIERDGKYVMRLSNRTYASEHEVPAERVPLWKERLGR